MDYGDVIYQFKKSDPCSDTKERCWTCEVTNVYMVVGNEYKTGYGKVIKVVDVRTGYSDDIPEDEIGKNLEYGEAKECFARVLVGIEEKA